MVRFDDGTIDFYTPMDIPPPSTHQSPTSSSELDDLWPLLPFDRCYGEPDIWCDNCKEALVKIVAWSDKRTLDIIGEDESEIYEEGLLEGEENEYAEWRNELRAEQRARLANNTKEQK